jgi:hypothetical protein
MSLGGCGAGAKLGQGMQEMDELTGGYWSGSNPILCVYLLTRKGHSLNSPQGPHTRYPYFTYHGAMAASYAS